jgi:16S rRNA (cytosine1402-N4)-methyltransferase
VSCPARENFIRRRKRSWRCVSPSNREQEELDALLASIPALVKPGGRVVIITFMSLEDRKVKHGFQAMAKAGGATLLTRHVVRPAEDEIRDNPPSRSAKLRAIELL